MDDADDWEEDQLVLVELAGLLEQEVLFKASSPLCRLHGVDSERPILQIGPYAFIGHYEDVIGTHCIFEETTDNNNEKRFQFKAKTDKCLKMERAFLRSKTENNENSSSDGSSNEDNNDGDDDDDDNDENVGPQDDVEKEDTNIANKQQDAMEIE